MERIVTALNDTIISEASPSTPYEARPTLTVRNVTDKRQFAFVIARGVTPRADAVTPGAVLRLFPTEDFPSTTFIVRRPAAAWTPSSLWWNNRPDPGPIVVEHTAAGIKEQPFDIPITAEVAAWLAGTTPNRGVRIETTSSAAAGRSFHSVNASGTKAPFKPLIIMQVSYPPAAPVDISPSGGAQVSVSDPVATWRYGGGEDVAPMAAYQVQTFTGEASAFAPSPVMNERFASFNYHGIGDAADYDSRFAGIINTMWASGASVFGCQEADSATSPGQALEVNAALNAHSGSSAQWEAFIGENLNVVYVDTAVFEPQWDAPTSKHLGDNKYVVSLLLKHIVSGAEMIFATTHYLTSSELTKQIAHTRVLIAFAAAQREQYGVPFILTGDFNAKDKSANRPMGMLALAGLIDVRDLVDTVTNGTYNSHDSYGANGMNGWWIDHLLVSGGPVPTAVGLTDSGTSSDHNLVHADVEYATSLQLVADLGTPSTDTGEVSSAVPQHQFSGVVDQVFARYRHMSADGLWSKWSEAVVFGKTDLPTVTITSTEVTTNDTSPTTTWDVTGGTQTAFQVLHRRVDTGSLVVDSMVISGADQQWQSPQPIPVELGVELTREVRIWDGLNRMPTVGVPIYAEAFGPVFTIEPDAVIAPVTDVTVTRHGGPVNSVSWARTPTGDSFVVERRLDDEEPVRFAVQAGAAALGGGLFRWFDVTAPAEYEITYTVHAVDNGAIGPGAAAEPFFRPADYIWLADPDDPDWFVPIAGKDQGTWSLGEDSTVINVKGSDRTNLIHEGLRGYEGSVAGALHSDQTFTDHATARQYRERMWETKRKPTKLWRLVLSDLNIPVVVREVDVTPTPGPTLWYGVSLEFLQQGEIPWAER